ncbi:MAG: DNA polymerase I [Deltaproteobacteria bacterium]|nr:MAG: DNA polymerase I [Deltaproteobacteria bacterium]
MWDLDHDLESLVLRPMNRPALAARLRRYNFRSLLRELGLEDEPAPETGDGGAGAVGRDGGEGPAGSGGPGGETAASDGDAPAVRIDRSAYRTITSPADLDWLVGELQAAGRFAYDSETTSLDPLQATVVGMSFCWRDDMAVYVPIAHTAGDNCPGALDRLLPLLADPALKKTGQNLKYDLEVLSVAGHGLAGIDGDCMLADYLLDVDRKHGLDELALRHLGHEMLHYKDVAGPHGHRFEAVPVDEATAYAAEDAHVAWLLDRILTERLGDPGQRGPAAVYRDIELPLVPVLAAMELAGIGVDVAALERLSEELGQRIDRLVAQVQEVAGQEFNLNSTQQLARILFEERGHKPVKKTAKRTGFSTDSATLEALARSGDDPLPRLILDYRELAKLKSTYVDALPRAVGPDGRIHTSFHQAVAATGRLSSNDPNLQNIPVRTEEGRRIRRAFVARPGYRFLSADYSQVELRVLAHFCGEGALVDAFRQGQDIHRRTASEIFGVDMEAVTPEQRRAAKAINFGIIYGMSAFRLARELEIGRGEAKAYMDGYFARYPEVRRYMERAVQEGSTRGYAETLFGRRRPLRGLDSRNFNVRSGAERIAINTPVQGTAADLIKLAMIRVADRLGREHPDATLLLQVHDELLVEAPEADTEAVGRLLVEEMQGVAELAVPLVVDLGVGTNWDEAH